MTVLLSLTNFNNSEWNLIYRATRDGFGANDFHSKCDTFKNTLTLIKTTKSFIIGGFTTQTFGIGSVNDIYKGDPNAFLISLKNSINIPKKFTINTPNWSIICHNGYGPIFGVWGSGINIADKSNINRNSYWKPGSLSSVSVYLSNGALYDISLLDNEENFQTVEIETYNIQ